MENFLIDKYNCTVPLTTDGLNLLCPIFPPWRSSFLSKSFTFQAVFCKLLINLNWKFWIDGGFCTTLWKHNLCQMHLKHISAEFVIEVKILQLGKFELCEYHKQIHFWVSYKRVLFYDMKCFEWPDLLEKGATGFE